MAVPWFPGCVNGSLTTFPTPHNRPDIQYGVIRQPRRVPTSCYRPAGGGGSLIRNTYIERYERPGYGYGRLWKGGKGINTLADKSVEAPGDFGWTLDYATAWLYRHLTSSVPDIADAIDICRDIGDDDVSPEFAYLFFDMLDTRIFAGKLKDAVYLRWRSFPSSLPGVTSAPKVVSDVPRICIELNRTPFQDDDAEIDDLLGALIHQMIHAFLLVCCGAQSRRDAPDDRLMDGVHFGLILMTIREATRFCLEGALDLVFHASKRRNEENDMLGLPQPFPPGLEHPTGESFIALDPRGHGHASMLHDGQTHCNHDNRHISKQLIKNWQVTEYSKALEADMEAKGDKIWDFVDGDTFEQFDRTAAPPSATYIELVYDDLSTPEPKRIMADRHKALKFKSLKIPLTTYLKFELLIPAKCDIQTFRCIYDFINKNGYLATPTDQAVHLPITNGRGPPVLYHRAHNGMTQLPHPILALAKDESAITHIKVFKAGEKMKFEELMDRAIQKLYQIPITTEDPIALLKQIYNIEPPSTNPIHSELHKWSRRFLARKEDQVPGYMTQMDPLHAGQHLHAPPQPYGSGSWPNMRKIKDWYPQQWRELLHESRAFRDDVKLAIGQLSLEASRPVNPAVLVHRHQRQQALLEAGGIAAPLGLAHRGVAGLLPAGTGIMNNEFLLGGGLDDLDIRFDDIGFGGGVMDPPLMASARRHSFMPGMSRSMASGLGGNLADLPFL